MNPVSYENAEPKNSDVPMSLDVEKGTRRRSRRVPFIIGGTALLVLLVFGWMVKRAERNVNWIALNQSPKPVTVVEARAATFRPSRAYVGTIEPWVEAKVGPQLVSSYVDTVLVRPGAVVKKGEVLATLDCRNASAGSQAVAIARETAADEIEGGIARRGAIAAAIRARDWLRAVSLATTYLAEGLPADLISEVTALRDQAEGELSRQRPPEVKQVRFELRAA